nr:uncharacterized protein Dmel_CG1835, isoform C [Drosophila melanogaster]AAN09534.2 uncharacterized protein Dmel_CG1835, isoform C [Drosophila melanogaster]|eukprot:NP_728356.2 uncharacterized protein Dmel_CG1835, isoform C [Drosophila melanogaster]
MQSLSAQRNRKSDVSEKKAVETTVEWGRGPQAGDRLPTAVSLLRRNSTDSARNEVKTAFIRYEKSMNELAKSARKLYKNARLRSLPLRKPMMRGKIGDSDARPLRTPVPSAWAITERENK